MSSDEIYAQPRFAQLKDGISDKIKELYPDFPLDRYSLMKIDKVPSKDLPIVPEILAPKQPSILSQMPYTPADGKNKLTIHDCIDNPDVQALKDFLSGKSSPMSKSSNLSMTQKKSKKESSRKKSADSSKSLSSGTSEGSIIRTDKVSLARVKPSIKSRSRKLSKEVIEEASMSLSV